MSGDPQVLLVEDNPDDAMLIARAFEKARIVNPLQRVEDGEKAIAYISGTPPYNDRARYPLPALVLLDLKLPRRSGFEVLEWIRATPATRHIPVVVLTSSDQASDVRRAYDLHANSYLVKPVGSDALLAMVKTLDVYWLMLNRHVD